MYSNDYLDGRWDKWNKTDAPEKKEAMYAITLYMCVEYGGVVLEHYTTYRQRSSEPCAKECFTAAIINTVKILLSPFQVVHRIWL